MHIGLTACLAIGPLLFLYLRSILEKKYTFKLIDALHFIPSVALFSFSFFMGFWEFHHIWIHIVQTILAVWALYILLAIYKIYLFKDSENFKLNKLWIISILVGTSLIWLAYKTSSYTSYIVGALTFTVRIYFLILLLVTRTKTKRTKITRKGFKNK